MFAFDSDTVREVRASEKRLLTQSREAAGLQHDSRKVEKHIWQEENGQVHGNDIARGLSAPWLLCTFQAETTFMYPSSLSLSLSLSLW